MKDIKSYEFLASMNFCTNVSGTDWNRPLNPYKDKGPLPKNGKLIQVSGFSPRCLTSMLTILYLAKQVKTGTKCSLIGQCYEAENNLSLLIFKNLRLFYIMLKDSES